MTSLQPYLDQYVNPVELSAQLSLNIGQCEIAIHSNSEALITTLRDYFEHVVTTPSSPDLTVIAIESEALSLDLDFKDWKREGGKTGRKDSYLDLADGRIARKVKTGMMYFLNQTQHVVIGPCRQNDNQVINFINAQYMTWLQHRQWVICHASALVYQQQALAFAAFSGGGKSTLMLHMMDRANTQFMSNDRLLIQAKDNRTLACGIPKLPRINPGTIVHNPTLHPLLSAERREQLLAMPPEQLWDLEEKYDVMITDVYGQNRIQYSAPLAGFVILNWQHDHTDATELHQVDLATRPDLLAAVMKSPGPFHQLKEGPFYQDSTQLNADEYLAALAPLKVYEVTGKVDFHYAVEACFELLTE